MTFEPLADALRSALDAPVTLTHRDISGRGIPPGTVGVSVAEVATVGTSRQGVTRPVTELTLWVHDGTANGWLARAWAVDCERCRLLGASVNIHATDLAALPGSLPRLVRDLAVQERRTRILDGVVNQHRHDGEHDLYLEAAGEYLVVGSWSADSDLARFDLSQQDLAPHLMAQSPRIFLPVPATEAPKVLEHIGRAILVDTGRSGESTGDAPGTRFLLSLAEQLR